VSCGLAVTIIQDSSLRYPINFTSQPGGNNAMARGVMDILAIRRIF
jgi:hypothetical protein